MARVFIEGFESGSLTGWNTTYGSPAIVSSPSGMHGNYCLWLDTTDGISRIVPSRQDYYFAYKWKPGTYWNSTNMSVSLSVWNSDTLNVWVGCYASNNKVYVYRGGTWLASSVADTVSPGTTFLIEVYFSIANTGGRAIVKVDGNTVIDFTGDTQDSASAVIDKIQFGEDIGVFSNAYGECYIDDFVIDNSDWIGNTQIQALVPNGAGNYTQWTPSTGSNYQCVDEVPASGTDYVSTNTVDQIDTYTLSDMAGAIQEVKAIQAEARLYKEGNPTPTQAALVLRTDSTDYAGSDQALATTYEPIYELWEDNPDTTSAWTESEVNALEVGMKSRT